MKKIEECKEYYKEVYTSVLAMNGFEKNIFECVELARYDMHCEMLKFVYGAEFEKIERFWQREALKEFYK